MQVFVTGKQIDIGNALHSHVESRLSDQVSKYFDHPLEGSVVFAREGRGRRVRADISVHVGRGIMVQSQAETTDPYSAFDGALERIAKQLRRCKRRLRDHHRRPGTEIARSTRPASQYVFAGEAEENESHSQAADGQPVVIAEMPAAIETMTVSEAVMRRDLADLPALVFQNSAHGGLNVVYLRPDGNVGWIDPDGNAGRR